MMNLVMHTVFIVTLLWGKLLAANPAEVYNRNEWYNRPMIDRYATPEPVGTPLYNQLVSTDPRFTPLFNIPKPGSTPLYDNYPTTSPSDGSPLHIRPEPDTTPLYGYWPLDNLRPNPNRLTDIQIRPELVETPLYDGYGGAEHGSTPLYGYWLERGDGEKSQPPLATTGTYVNRYSPNMLPGTPLNFGVRGGDKQSGSSLGGMLGSAVGSTLSPYLGSVGTALGHFLGPILGYFGSALIRLLSSMNTGTKTPSEAPPDVANHYDAYLVDFPEYGKHIVLTDPSKPNPFLKTKEDNKDKITSAKPMDKNGVREENGDVKNDGMNMNDEDYSVDNFKNLMEHQELLHVQEAEDEEIDGDVLINSN